MHGPRAYCGTLTHTVLALTYTNEACGASIYCVLLALLQQGLCAEQLWDWPQCSQYHSITAATKGQGQFTQAIQPWYGKWRLVLPIVVKKTKKKKQLKLQSAMIMIFLVNTVQSVWSQNVGRAAGNKEISAA